MAKGGDSSRHHSDALVGVSVLHSAFVFDCLLTMEDTLRHLREEGRRYKDILDLASLQTSDERIQLGLGTS